MNCIVYYFWIKMTWNSKYVSRVCTVEYDEYEEYVYYNEYVGWNFSKPAAARDAW